MEGDRRSDAADSTFIASFREDATPASESPSPPASCTNCILVTRLLTLGDTAGPGFLEATDRLVRDGAGRYWVGQPTGIKLYDGAGRFIRQIGRAGEGPMEFSWAGPFHVDEAGNVHVLDMQRPRITVIGPSFNLERTIALPNVARFAAALDDGEDYVLSLSLPTAELIGMPIHILGDDNRIHSFGLTEEQGIVAVRGRGVHRVLAAHPDRRIVSIPPDDYAVEVWSLSGERVRAFNGRGFRQRPNPTSPWSYENPPGDIVSAVDVDDRGRLWIITLRLRDDWAAAMREIPSATGVVRLQPHNDDLSRLYRSWIEILDPNTGEVLASAVFDEAFVGFPADGLLASLEYVSSNPHIGIWSIELTP